MIAIIDYGAGNIQSVYKALKYINCDAIVTNDKDKILAADGAILPGVGSFGDTINTMEQYNIKDTVIKDSSTYKEFCNFYSLKVKKVPRQKVFHF